MNKEELVLAIIVLPIALLAIGLAVIRASLIAGEIILGLGVALGTVGAVVLILMWAEGFRRRMKGSKE